MSLLYDRADRPFADGAFVSTLRGSTAHRVACSSELDGSVVLGCGRVISHANMLIAVPELTDEHLAKAGWHRCSNGCER